MIISTKKGTPKEELEKIVDKFEHQGLDVALITGKDYNVFGLVGDTTKIDERDVLANPWIDNVTRVSAPYKRANRLFHPADSVIDCGGVKIGSKEKIAVMAGPSTALSSWKFCILRAPICTTSTYSSNSGMRSSLISSDTMGRPVASRALTMSRIPSVSRPWKE